MGGHEGLDVTRLRQLDLAVLGLRDLDVKEIGDRALVLDVPVRDEALGEGLVDRVLVVMRVQGEEVIDVAADDQGLLTRSAGRMHSLAPDEHARVGLGDDEALTKEVGEDGPLPAPSRLRHAVDGLLDAKDSLGAGGVGRVEAGLVSLGHRAVDHLVVEQLALEVGGDEVPSTHDELLPGGQRGEHA